MDPTPKTPTIPTTESEPKILNFEEFIHRDEKDFPRYNNFFLRFDLYGDFYRKHSYYTKFVSEHPEMETELCKKIQTRDRVSKINSENLKPFEQDLYEAYKIMRSYGASDRELFV